MRSKSLINEIESIYDEVRYNATTYINSTVLVLCCTDPTFTYKKLGLSVRVRNNPYYINTSGSHSKTAPHMISVFWSFRDKSRLLRAMEMPQALT